MTQQEKAFFKGYGIEVSFNFGANPCIHITNSYLIKNNADREMLLDRIHKLDEYKTLLAVGYTRSRKSQLNEWAGHNFLYNLGYQRNRTANVDIDQNEPKWRRACYTMFSIFMR